MTTNNRNGPIVDPGLCRCCGTMKKCRFLNIEYEWIGQKEIYSDMFVDTFGLLLSNLDGEAKEQLICATCVSRLRDASAFRRQVLIWEKMLLQASLAPEDLLTEIKEEPSQSESKEERECVSSISIEVPAPPGELLDDHTSCEDVGGDPDVEDSNEAMPIKQEAPAKPQKKIKKLKAKPKQKSSKTIARKKKIKTKKKSLEVTLDQLRTEDNIKYELPPKPPPNAGEQRSRHNAATLIECSFVCPFDSQFSDFLCAYCRRGFTDPGQLRAHTHAHDPAQFKNLVNTKKILQVDITRIDCRLCPEPIYNIEHLKLHLKNTHGKLLHSCTNEFLKFRLTSSNLCCTECDSSFSFFHALKKHMAEHFGTCICDICGAHYFEERMLVLHQKTHQRVEESFPCAQCGKNFKSKHSRYLHEARTHKKEPAYQCQKCDEVLFSYSLRYRHMIEVHGERRTYPCSHCDRAYDSRKSLREHNRRYHLKVFKHQCDLCDKRFYIPSRLKEHLATHTGERNYRCDLCGKSYPRLRGLKVHLQSHNSEKKFRCELCNASFTQNVNLKNHMKRQHQGLDIEEGFRD